MIVSHRATEVAKMQNLTMVEEWLTTAGVNSPPFTEDRCNSSGILNRSTMFIAVSTLLLPTDCVQDPTPEPTPLAISNPTETATPRILITDRFTSYPLRL